MKTLIFLLFTISYCSGQVNIEIFNQINTERHEHGLRKLRYNYFEQPYVDEVADSLQFKKDWIAVDNEILMQVESPGDVIGYLEDWHKKKHNPVLRKDIKRIAIGVSMDKKYYSIRTY